MKNKPKPRVLWANYYGESVYVHNKESDAVACRSEYATTIRVAVIPLDDCEAFFADQSGEGVRAALTEAGIPCGKASK